MTVREWLRQATGSLTAAGVDNADGDSRSLLAYVLRCREQELVLTDQCLEKEQESRLAELLTRRRRREPLQHLLGSQCFYGYDFLVGPQVLIPRWDTENLVEACLNYLKKEVKTDSPKVCDVCTGSGCIAVTLALEYPSARVTAADISEEALLLAQANGKRLQAEVKWVQGDLLAPVDGDFDLIVSNPPYIKTADLEELQPEVRDHDPRLALDGGADGLEFYRRLAVEAFHHLKAGGLLALEIGSDQAEAVTGLLIEQGYRKIEVKQDLSGLDRVILARKSLPETE
ncbi:MAG: peptide chain release factor N(5)-glutamine methyltransferase [Lachnospiraceae bacterium]|nr:peptide chain release factor N(5)-glutamine methyltransferase [Lachnospiraceae bacterium]MDY5741570.1 peptide chain release factor N(5)-glutamine methyltransferase [Lachnospiraceae bacterium]